MVQPLTYLKESPSQTAGPYVHIGCTPQASGISGVYPQDLGATMITDPVAGHQITLSGQVIDGMGAPLRDVLLEIWQADAAGLFNTPQETRGQADPNFTGWGRCASDQATGEFAFQTVKPGPVPWRDGRPQAPHITVWIVARGINLGLQTRCYFEDEDKANNQDPVLQRIEHQFRRQTLIAKKTSDATYRFDIRLQGEEETVFFDI